MKKENSLLHLLWEYAVITASCAVYALSFNWFFQPNNIVMGGFTGIAQILNRLIPGLPVGMTVLVMNVPLLILGVRKQGPKLLVGTLFATAVSSLMIDGLDMLYTFPATEPLLACVYGGLLLGVIEIFAGAYISTDLSDAVVFAVLIIVLLVRPAGLMGKYVPEKV